MLGSESFGRWEADNVLQSDVLGLIDRVMVGDFEFCGVVSLRPRLWVWF